MEQKGYFDIESKEYVITDMFPLRPLKNYLFNSKMVSTLDQFGFGPTNVINEHGPRAVLQEERLIYIKDEESDEYYAANRNYMHLPFSQFETRVGIGYQKIISTYKELQVEYTIVIPKDNLAEISNVKIRNFGNKARKISLYSLVKPHVNVTWHAPYTKTAFNVQTNSLEFAHDGFNLTEKNVFSLYKSDTKITSFSFGRRFFTGQYNDFSNPLAVKEKQLGNEIISFEEELLAVIHTRFTIEANETKEINFAYVLADSLKNRDQLAQKYGSSENFNNEMLTLKMEQESLEEACHITTPDAYLNVQMNTWIKRQISLGKTWGRVYGKGFRDVLQDVAAFTSFDPETARERILLTLSYMKGDGNTIRQFDPIFDEPYRDGASWIPQTLLTYIKETNDLSILDEVVGYYDINEKDTVFAHVVRGLDFLLNGLGQRGLCLWGGGDWNDSMNNCGTQGVGESVWLSLATVKAVNEFVELVNYARPQFDITSFSSRQQQLIRNIKTHGFDIDHLIYGINDEHERVGSYKYKEYGSIYLNPQTWAILANICTPEEANALMDVVEENLKCDYGYTLANNAITKGSDKIGRVSYFAPGCFENASVYIHAVTFKIAADLLIGRADQAYETMKMIRHDNPLNLTSGMEPYAISNMFIGPELEALKGYSPQSWITGSAGWLFRNVVELMLGVQPGFNGLILKPCLPTGFDNVQVKRRYRGAMYDIRIFRTGVRKLIVDGQKISGNIIPIFKKNTTHIVEYYY